MITLIPINKNIQKTLHEKIGMLGKDEEFRAPPIGEPQTDEKGVAPENYMFTRVPFLRAVSFTQQIKSKNKVVILSGGKLSKWGRLRAGFSDRNVDVNDTISSDKKLNEFGLYTAPNSDNVDDIPYRPIAGVKDINIDYKGGGMMLGATRTAQMSWTCWTWEELNELTPHFLTPGRTVLLEWGWSGLGKLQDTQLLDIIKPNNSEIDPTQITNLQQKILQHIIEQKGHYDAMLGLVQTFDWTVRDDGGFDCSTTLVAPGVTMLQQFVKNLNSKAYSQLPGLVTQTQVKKEPWLWFNTKEQWEWKQGGPSSDDIAGLVPYITFKEYMANFTTQVKEFVKQKGYGAWTGSPKSRFQVMTLGLMEKPFGGRNYLPFQSGNATYLGSVPGWHGGGYFVTWGWFEDNVLSRFFGNVKESGEQKEVLGEFRSFEQDIDDETGEFKVTSDGDPIYRATRMYNSRYLITVDSAQWVIPNKNDPVMRSVDAFGPIDALGKFKNIDPNSAAAIKDFAKKIEGSAYESGEVNMSQWNNWEFRRACRMKADEEGLAMRDVYFNAGYLQEKLKNVDDLMQGIMTIWEEFSSTYGGIYSFHVDFDDNGNRLILRERGYAGKRAFNLLSAEERSSRENSTGLFEFPIWEKGSIVKSNSLNGKLPDRMKMAAMYGANSIKSKEEDDDGVQGTYDDLAGKAWGNLQAPKSKDGATEEEIMEDRYDDLMSGRIDTPSRDNRFFGQIRADMDKELTVGGVSKIEKEWKSTPAKGIGYEQETSIPRESLPDSGMQIYPGIEIAIEASAKAEMLNRARQLSGKEFNETDDDGNPTAGVLTNATKIANTSKEMAEEFKKYNAVDGAPSPGHGRVDPVSMKFYEMRPLDDVGGIGVASADSVRPALKNEYKFAMQKLLRGDDDGVMKQVDPLIPIEFEMEIDGTGGLFPGNSFHSTYLPKRYREEALLQMTKVNHSVSSDGWSVTIKGQMRAVSNFAEKMALEPSPAEKQRRKQALARIEAEKKIEDQKKKAAQKEQSELKVATTIEFLDISFDKKTIADITKNVPGLEEGTGQYDKANPVYKQTVANELNEKRDFLEKGRSVRTLEYLQDQFKSGNEDWAQNANIVTQLQQTIKDFGYPNLPTWWGDGDFGPGTQEILGNFLNGQVGSEYMNDSNQYAYIISGFDVLGD